MGLHYKRNKTNGIVEIGGVEIEGMQERREARMEFHTW
jgi:hypothetical protein